MELIAPPGSLIDCHSDLMVDVFRRRKLGERKVLKRVHLPALREGGVVACVCTCGGDVPALQPLGARAPYDGAVGLLDALNADVEESDGAFVVARSSVDIERAVAQGTLALVPGLEGASPIEGDLGRLVDLYERGIRVLGLTWNSANELAVGLDAGEGGLSMLGVRAVEIMNRLGVMIDLAHASPATFWDVVQVSAAPLVASHANAKGVWNHPRNLDDDQLEALAASGGIVGVCCYPSFLGPQPLTLEDVLDHADYLLRHVGHEGVVIGADFIDYAVEELVGDLREHSDLYPDGSFTYPRGLETAAELQNLVHGLETRTAENVVEMVCTSNFLSVLSKTEQVAETAGVAP